MKKYKSLGSAAAVAATLLSIQTPALADTEGHTPSATTGSLLLPNRGARTLTIPSAWGVHGGTIFGAVGYTNPQVFSDNDDAVISVGAGIGNPTRLAALQVGISMNDVSEGDNFSFNAKLHKYIGHGITVAVGGENLLADTDGDSPENDADESYYAVVSRASQRWRSKTDGVSRLNVSLGLGSGRFTNKSPADELAGNGSDGSVVFGAVAFELFRHFNLIADWNGTNLAAGIGFSPIQRLPLAITLGAADLTDNSGDDVRFIGTVTFGIKPFQGIER